jgi:hypothetical protein
MQPNAGLINAIALNSATLNFVASRARVALKIRGDFYDDWLKDSPDQQSRARE